MIKKIFSICSCFNEILSYLKFLLLEENLSNRTDKYLAR